MLEPDDGKLSSPVLRGLAPSNGGWLLGPVALAPVVKLAGSNAQPLRKSSDADLGLLRPASDKIHHLIPHIMRHPVLGQSSPRLFFSAMCSAISSARTSSLVCTFFSKNEVRFCFSST